MQTVRNRLAQTSRNGAKMPLARSSCEDVTFMLRLGAQPPPGFPADLIVPPHRGAVITAASWPPPAVSKPVEPAHALAQPLCPGMSRKAARKATRRAAAVARAAADAVPSTADLIIVAAPVEPECAPALARPSGSGVRMDPAPAEIMAGPEVPLPSPRALGPRRQGFIDILAFVLRDSGRRLSRWSSAKRRADDMKDKLARAEARLRAMEAQLSALQALQERVRQSG